MPNEFKGPIIDVRFIEVADGRKMMQITRDGRNWIMPPLVKQNAVKFGDCAPPVIASREEHENNDGQ